MSGSGGGGAGGGASPDDADADDDAVLSLPLLLPPRPLRPRAVDINAPGATCSRPPARMYNASERPAARNSRWPKLILRVFIHLTELRGNLQSTKPL